MLGHANGSRADVQFSAGVVVRPEPVTGGDRAVHDGRSPVVGTGRLKRHRAVGVAETGHATGRIVIIGQRTLRRKESYDQQQTEQACKLEQMSSHISSISPDYPRGYPSFLSPSPPPLF